jgi:FAD/FMN-containing dehydrogenase
MTPQTSELVQLDLDSIRRSVTGPVIGPDDAEYDAARTVMLGGIDARPAVIVRVADTDDVRTVIRLARETGLDLAVRSGGHSGAAHGTADGGIVLDVRDLNGLEIDEASRTAWAGSGLTAAEYTIAAAELGLATGFGDTGSVGLGGITTGGGIGYLVRKHGLTIDSLLAAEIVTADGAVRVVDEDHEPDLFWAIRGGGGNFGVVTRFRFRLHPVPEAVGGMLFLPATADTIAGFVAAAQAAPEALSTIANVMPCPPMPFVPEEQHGKLVIFGLLCWAGPVDEGQAAMAPFRALATPVADMLRPISYAEMYPPAEPDYHPLAISRTFFIDRFDPAVAETVLEHLEASDAAMRAAQIRALGGAMARVDPDATAFALRDRPIMVTIASFYEGDHDKARREAWVTNLAAALHQRDGAYVNFLADGGEGRIHDAYPGRTWDRLVEAKRRYDPENLFHRNQNIPPGGETR